MKNMAVYSRGAGTENEQLVTKYLKQLVRFNERPVKHADFAKLGSQGHSVQLKQYFSENVRPQRREIVARGET